MEDVCVWGIGLRKMAEGSSTQVANTIRVRIRVRVRVRGRVSTCDHNTD